MKFSVEGNGIYAFITAEGDKKEYFTKEELINSYPEQSAQIEEDWEDLKRQRDELQNAFSGGSHVKKGEDDNDADSIVILGGGV